MNTIMIISVSIVAIYSTGLFFLLLKKSYNLHISFAYLLLISLLLPGIKYFLANFSDYLSLSIWCITNTVVFSIFYYIILPIGLRKLRERDRILDEKLSLFFEIINSDDKSKDLTELCKLTRSEDRINYVLYFKLYFGSLIVFPITLLFYNSLSWGTVFYFIIIFFGYIIINYLENGDCFTLARKLKS